MEAIEFNFKNGNKSFPLSTDVLDCIQQALSLLSITARLGGNWYILKGCQRSGNQISDGIVICEDMILPFEGGTITDRVKIVTTKQDITVRGKVYKEAIITRKLVGTNETVTGTLPWSYFKPKMNYVVPKGVIVDYSGNSDNIPEGWELYSDAGASPLKIKKI